MEPQSTQEKLMPVKLFFGGRNNAIAGLDSNLITTPGTQYICMHVHISKCQSGTPPIHQAHGRIDGSLALSHPWCKYEARECD